MFNAGCYRSLICNFITFVSPLQTTEATAIIMMADTVVEEVVAVGKV